MWLLAISITLILLIIGAIAGGYRYKWVWAGFSERKFVKDEDEEIREARTLWDWLQLLIVPAALASIALLFNQVQAERDQTRADERARVDREIAADNQQEEVLGSYTEAMSKLMLESHLRDSKRDPELRVVARTRTLSALRRLNGERKGIVLQFLADANLIRLNHPAVDMTSADLSSTIARQANLSKVHLTQVDLPKADLSGSNLEAANLGFSNLAGANLRYSDLAEANLRYSDLAGADLGSSSLVGADLRFSDLAGADMSSAKLCGATLQDAFLARVELNGAIADPNTTRWPTNFDWRSAGVQPGSLNDRGECKPD